MKGKDAGIMKSMDNQGFRCGLEVMVIVEYTSLEMYA
jgi:hypothetical protein